MGLSEYDRRQLGRILQVIADYRSGEKPLGALVNDIEALLACLENVPTDTVDELLGTCGELETAYATRLEQSFSKKPTSTKDGVVDASVAKIHEMVSAALK